MQRDSRERIFKGSGNRLTAGRNFELNRNSIEDTHLHCRNDTWYQCSALWNSIILPSKSQNCINNKQKPGKSLRDWRTAMKGRRQTKHRQWIIPLRLRYFDYSLHNKQQRNVNHWRKWRWRRSNGWWLIVSANSERRHIKTCQACVPNLFLQLS